MSRLAKKGQILSLDLLPELTEGELAEKLTARRMLPPEELFTGVFHRRVGECLLRQSRSHSPQALAALCKDFRVTVQAADAAAAQVTRGGADTGEFDAATLESRLWPGLYVIGEALDVDGRCGGYNLHWAFASGIAAGRSSARG